MDFKALRSFNYQHHEPQKTKHPRIVAKDGQPLLGLHEDDVAVKLLLDQKYIEAIPEEAPATSDDESSGKATAVDPEADFDSMDYAALRDVAKGLGIPAQGNRDALLEAIKEKITKPAG